MRLALKVLEILKKRKVSRILTLPGATGTAKRRLAREVPPRNFTVSTKFSGAWSNLPANREEITKSVATSFDLLKTDQVAIHSTPPGITPGTHKSESWKVFLMYGPGRYLLLARP